MVWCQFINKNSITICIKYKDNSKSVMWSRHIRLQPIINSTQTETDNPTQTTRKPHKPSIKSVKVKERIVFFVVYLEVSRMHNSSPLHLQTDVGMQTWILGTPGFNCRDELDNQSLHHVACQANLCTLHHTMITKRHACNLLWNVPGSPFENWTSP